MVKDEFWNEMKKCEESSLPQYPQFIWTQDAIGQPPVWRSVDAISQGRPPLDHSRRVMALQSAFHAEKEKGQTTSQKQWRVRNQPARTKEQKRTSIPIKSPRNNSLWSVRGEMWDGDETIIKLRNGKIEKITAICQWWWWSGQPRSDLGGRWSIKIRLVSIPILLFIRSQWKLPLERTSQ